MQFRSRLHTLAATAVLAGSAVSTLGTQTAAAAPGPAAHFVVLGPQGSDLSRTADSVAAAGGQVVQSWPQIGVLIATSSNINFAQAVRRMAGVQGAGSTRALVEFAPPQTFAPLAATGLERLDSTSATARTATVAAGAEPLEANQWNLRLIRADAASLVSQGDHNLVVGVLDSGIDATHPDLAPNVDAADSVGCTNQGIPDTSPAAWLPTTSFHGTHVAGTIAAARNGIGVAGVAPNVRVASIKVVDDTGSIYPEYAICGFIEAAEHHVKVTNNSYFIDPWFKWCKDDPDQKAVVQAVSRAVDYSTDHDVANVVSTGNSNWDLAHTVNDTGSPDNATPIPRQVGNECPQLPQEINGVVGVSAVGATARKSFYSNYGVGDTEVTAPGGDSRVIPNTPDHNGRVLSTVPGGGWGYAQGTSMASPHTAGVLALIRSTHPDWTAKRAVQALDQEADQLACPPGGTYDPTGDGAFLATCHGGPSGQGFYGNGLVDALDAVTR